MAKPRNTAVLDGGVPEFVEPGQRHAHRLTFRNVVHDVAWQRQLRDRHAREGLPAGLTPAKLALKHATVKAVSRNVAEQVILKYEWLGTMAATTAHYGIFFGPYCAGVTCVAIGSGSGGTNVHKPFAIDRHALAVLARGACVHWAPQGANSKLVSWTARLLARDYPSVKLMIAYADSDAGEIGTIYQACGWTYIGQGSPTRQWINPAGRVMDQKLPSNIAHGIQKKQGEDAVQRADVVRALRDAGWREQESNPKHRYVTLVDKADSALVARVRAMALPYPKRDDERASMQPIGPGSKDDVAAADQAEEDGSIPIPGLQLPPDPLVGAL